ncbi:MAG TPA: hypothetical protein VLJ61_18995 [Pyrinomonadaceae bacterium]|nr:hypothetical protein [Pyrinomonadaceae bacterium]
MRTALRKNLGLTLVVGLIVVLGGTALVMKGVGASVVVPAGYDTFTTPADAQTYDNFSSHPIDAGFFGPGSLQYTGGLTLKGGPPVDQTRWGSADTVIRRVGDVTVPGDTSLTVQGLSFVSASPITVQFSDGHNEQWDVTVNQSTATSSAGNMHFNSDGTFNSSLSIYPKYTFTRAGSTTRTLDTGSGGGGAPINLSSSNGTWSQSGSVTVINPGSEQSLLASHHVQPTPTPCPSPMQGAVSPSPSQKSATTTQQAVAINRCIATTQQ